MHKPQRPFLALFLRLCAAFGLSLLYLLVKLCHRDGVALPEIMFFRQAISVPVLLGWLVASGQMGALRTRRLRAHGVRAVMGTVGMVTNFGAAILLPLPMATILGFTTPLFAVILTALLLDEHVGRWRWLSVALGFGGVLVIANPASLTHAAISPLGIAAGLGSGFLVAVISLQIRDMARTEAPIAVVFYFSVFASVFTAPLLPFVMQPHSPAVWAEIAVMGLVGTCAQLLLTGALRFGSAASVLVMDYTSLVWTTLFSWLAFAQLPPAATWAGAPLIVAAGLVIAWREHRLHHDALLATEAEAR